jgi:transposase-like protein
MPNIRRSLPAKFKLKVIKYAEEHGNRKAGREFDVDEKSVRSWRKSKKMLIAMHPQKRA